MHVAQELVASLNKLASLPTLYYRVRDELNDPDVSTARLADLIASDPALASALLRLANSAFYGFPRKIETLTRAISLIGLDQVSDTVLTSSFATTFGGIRPQRMDMHRFWCGSVRRAVFCRTLARQRGDPEPERMFVIGLLSDAGHLVMYHAVPDLMGIVLDMPTQDIRELAEQERNIVGCDYTEVGAALTLSWRLPINIGTCIGAQLSPPNAGAMARDAALLNIAVMASEAIELDGPITVDDLPLNSETIDLCGIDPQVLPTLTEHAETQMSEILHSLGLG
ncbi:MAG TPA: HDOD domain-containing protein [Rhodocyclaceae bacterium]|nr:HDOD domain-containing protein [Rhodocyclaceae bacterium]